MDSLSGRVAVVTGAASGIGLALARGFAQEGMKVVAADIRADELAQSVATLEGEGATIIGQPTDVTKPEQIAALADLAFSRFGNVHVLCNNAGVGSGGLVWEIPDVDWHWVFDVNFWAIVRGVQAFLPRMLANGEPGHIVNTSSQAGVAPGNIGNAPYAASKHAVLAMTESLFKELKASGAQVSASVLCPGYINTNMGSHIDKARPADYGPMKVAERRATPMVGTSQDAGGSYEPPVVAEAVISSIKEDRFYIFPAQPIFFDWIRMGHERMMAGQNPAVPRRAAKALAES